MKKIFALALAIVMMMAIALPVFAVEDDTLESDDKVALDGGLTNNSFGNFSDAAPDVVPNVGDSMELKYGVAQSYVITIPADINFGYLAPESETYEAKRTVSASDVVINGKEYLVISVASNNNWQMVDKDAKSVNVDYTATLPTPTLKNDSATVKFDKNTVGAQQILVVDHAAGNAGVDSEDKGSDSVEIIFNTAGTAQEGTYIDTLTFSVLVTEIDPITDRA